LILSLVFSGCPSVNDHGLVGVGFLPRASAVGQWLVALGNASTRFIRSPVQPKHPFSNPHLSTISLGTGDLKIGFSKRYQQTIVSLLDSMRTFCLPPIQLSRY
jgi:hypothetical protein